MSPSSTSPPTEARPRRLRYYCIDTEACSVGYFDLELEEDLDAKLEELDSSPYLCTLAWFTEEDWQRICDVIKAGKFQDWNEDPE